MNKKGFTLVELLAVIVVLGVIMTVASSSVLTQKKKANIKEAEQLENTIEKLGPDVYLDKKEKDKKYDLSELKNYGLNSDSIKNPKGNGECSGYLEVTSSIEFKGHICCPGLYSSKNGEDMTGVDCNDNTTY